MNCPHCGLECSSRFCPDCGAPVNTGAPANTPAPTDPAGPAYPPAPAGGMVYPPAQGLPGSAARGPRSPLRQLLIFGALAGLVVGLVIVAVVLLSLLGPSAAQNLQLPATPRPSVNRPTDADGGDKAAAGLLDGSGEAPAFDAQAVLDQIEIFEYSYISYETPVVVLVLRNNAPQDVFLTVDLYTYGAQGQILAAKNAVQDAFAGGGVAVLDFWLDEEYATTSYEISVSPDTYASSAAQDLSYSLSEARDKLLLSVRNEGDKTAEWVYGHLLFFKGSRLVKHEVQSFGDSDYQLKPGRTVTREYYLSEYSTPDYDDVQVILVGTQK